MTSPAQLAPAWITSAAEWLTPSRILAQAIVLALCLWGVCAVDFATPGLFDRAGNIKFQDFLQFYISACLIREGRTSQLFNQHLADEKMRALIGEHAPVHLPPVYGPQVGLLFIPLARLSFPAAARIWVTLSLLAVGACLYLIWRSCLGLRPHARTVAICAVAYPPLFHFFVRGQISALVLVCFSAAFLAFRADRNWLAGIALGFLVFKPQFLVALPLVLLLSQAWKAFAGLAAAAGGQLALSGIYFGPTVMHTYFDTMLHMSRWIGLSEIGPAPIQMHSLRSFWTLLMPSPEIALALYVLSSIVIVAMAALVWKSSAALAVRFSALTLAAVLVNPHLFVYDLLALAPVLLLLVNWTLTNAHPASTPTLRLLLYLAFVLPLFGPLSRWTHVQLSVPAFAALLWVLWRNSGASSHKLASNESSVV
ncbi:MAG: glycosyltransferase family 87 protein [Candidatus Sulfotelmatobacter sp.]